LIVPFGANSVSGPCYLLRRMNLQSGVRNERQTVTSSM
jgi:hypothetical protein